MTIAVVGDSTGDNSDENAGKGSTKGVNHDMIGMLTTYLSVPQMAAVV